MELLKKDFLTTKQLIYFALNDWHGDFSLQKTLDRLYETEYKSKLIKEVPSQPIEKEIPSQPIENKKSTNEHNQSCSNNKCNNKTPINNFSTSFENIKLFIIIGVSMFILISGFLIIYFCFFFKNIIIFYII